MPLYAFREGDVDSAVRYLAAAAGLGTRQSKTRYLFARALVERRQVDDPIVKLTEALELNPQYNAARDLLSRLRTRQEGG